MNASLSRLAWVALPTATAVLLIGLVFGMERATSQETCGLPYATDHILVGMADDAPTGAVEEMKALNGDGAEEQLSSNVWSVDLPARVGVAQAIALYEVSPDVEYAETEQIAVLDVVCPPGTGVSRGFAEGPDPAIVGGELEYVIVALSRGPHPAPGVTAWTFVPDGTQLVSSTLSVGDSNRPCPPNDRGAIECRIGDLGAGETAKLTVVVRPTEPGRISTLADVWAADSPPIRIEMQTSTLVLPPPDCTVVGTAGPDLLDGTNGDDVFCGFGGDDVFSGGFGADVARGWSGDDTLSGGAGADRLAGGEGDDTLLARDGVRRDADRVSGGAGEDVIRADSWDRVRRD